MNQNKTVYLRGLNGLRAIAALTVVIYHVTLPAISDFGNSIFKIGFGFDGVTLFFVISGFLITYLLLLEKEKTNHISIKDFYIRRILRIWPIYYLFILISLCFAFYFAKINDIYSFKLTYYIFFTANIPFIAQTGISIIVHYWSIGVEEQFYLFWPWVIKLIKNKMFSVTILIILALFIVKSGLWLFLGNNSVLYKLFVVNRFHCMLIGASGAMLFNSNNKVFMKVVTNRYTQIVTWLITIILFGGILNVFIPAPIIPEITAIISLILIIGQVDTSSKKVINLENFIFDFLGKISYGIYVIHPIVILFFSYIYANLSLPIVIKSIIVYSSVIFTTLVLAYLSYEYYEKCFLKLKNKFTVIESANSGFLK